MISVSISINTKPIYTRSAVNTGERHRITNHVKYAAVQSAKKMLDTIQEYTKITSVNMPTTNAT